MYNLDENLEENENFIEEKQKWSWKYFLRQMLVCSGSWTIYFLTGLGFGAPTVFIPQIRREANSTHVITDDMASWLSSVFGYSGLPWVLILPILIKLTGIKIPFILVSLNTTIFYSILYWGSTPTHYLISEILQGMNHASNMTLTVILISEYASPKYRGIFLTIKSASLYWGVWVSNAIGTFFHWKYIPLFGLIASFYNLIVIFWPESPFYLAEKGRLEQCKKAHRWLKGVDKTSERELKNLINSDFTNKISFKCDFTSKLCYKPILLSMLMVSQYLLLGKMVCAMYSIDIIKKITSSEKTAYTGMLILDGVTVLSMYIGCGLSKIIKRRPLYLTTSVLGIIFLFIISIYLFLIYFSVIPENKIVTISLLSAFSVFIGAGPVILVSSIYGELIPLKYKTVGMMINGVLLVSLNSTFLKLSPIAFKKIGMHGTFLTSAIMSSICTFLLFLYLPETKDKTLQEIEKYFTDKPKETQELINVNKNRK